MRYEVSRFNRSKMERLAVNLTGHDESFFTLLSNDDLVAYVEELQSCEIMRPSSVLSIEDEDRAQRKASEKELKADRMRQQAMMTIGHHRELLERWGPTSDLRLSPTSSLFFAKVGQDEESYRKMQFLNIVSAPPMLEELIRRYKMGDDGAILVFSKTVVPLLREWAVRDGFISEDQDIRSRGRLQSLDPNVLFTYLCWPTLDRVTRSVRIIEVPALIQH